LTDTPAKVCSAKAKPMAISTIEVTLYTCERCGYEWIPRDALSATEPPKVCPNPKCKSPYWNTPRRETKPASKKKAGKKRTK
jgi:hypothetical protein